MTAVSPLHEQRRLERAIGRARFAGAGLAFVLGPIFPNLGLPHVAALGLALIGYGMVLRRQEGRTRSETEERRLAWIALAADASVVAYAMLVFSPDPTWTTFVLGVLIVIIGAFRLGGAGTIAGTTAMSVAYLAVALYRERAYGFDLDAARATFHVAFFGLSALLVSGILGEIGSLRRQRESALRREGDAHEVRLVAERLRSVLDSALDAVIGMDARGVITEWSPQAQSLFGWSRTEAVGRELATTIIPERYRAAHRGGLARYLATGEGPVLRRRIEIEGLRRDGAEVPVELSIVPLDGPAGPSFSAFVRDLTERREAEESARRRMALEQAEHARRALLRSASHELRTPLNAILGFLELLEEQLGASLADRQRRYMGHIREAGRSMLDLVEDVLELSDLEGGAAAIDARPIGVQALLEPTIVEARRAAVAKGLRLDLGPIPGAMVVVDTRRMQRLLVDLVSNAVKFTPAGGTVAIRCVVEGADLTMEVADTGVGIPPEMRESVFTIFERLHEGRHPASGTGLGLHLLKRIAELHGGTIGFRSDSGGTTFTVRLPGVVREPEATSA